MDINDTFCFGIVMMLSLHSVQYEETIIFTTRLHKHNYLPSNMA